MDFRKTLLQGELAEFTCLVGTMVQVVSDTNPSIRDARNKSICSHASTIEVDIAEAMQKYGIEADWAAEGLARYTQAVLQGTFVLAKAKGSPKVAVACVDHLHRYIEMLFRQALPRENDS